MSLRESRRQATAPTCPLISAPAEQLYPARLCSISQGPGNPGNWTSWPELRGRTVRNCSARRCRIRRTRNLHRSPNSTASKSGGQFGVFYPCVPLEPDRIATTSAWLYGLQQNAETRTNLGLTTAGLAAGYPNTFRIDLFDKTYRQESEFYRRYRCGFSGMGSDREYSCPVCSRYDQWLRACDTDGGQDPFPAYASSTTAPDPGNGREMVPSYRCTSIWTRRLIPAARDGGTIEPSSALTSPYATRKPS